MDTRLVLCHHRNNLQVLCMFFTQPPWKFVNNLLFLTWKIDHRKMAAKMDSRGGTRQTKVSFNRNGNLQSASSIPQTNDMNHEMHIKMSKKIAQLTKVIFSLNTKNDEFEEVVDALKNQHQSELERVTHECKEKITHYKQKMELVKEQETLISKLQGLLEDERKEKRQFISDLESFKDEKHNTEVDLRGKYESKVEEVSKKLLMIKEEFENRTEQFENVRKKLEKDKETAISDMNHKHSIEMEKLIKAHRVRYDELQSENNKLQQNIEKFKTEKNSEVSSRDSEMQSMADEYESKCEKMKRFYENELSAAKKKHESEFEEQIEKMRNEEKLLQMSMKRNEEALRNRIRALTENNEGLESKIEELQLSIEEANKELNNTMNNNNNYSHEVSQLQQELSIKDVRLQGLQNELNCLKAKHDAQTEDLLQKSAELGSLEAMKVANANLIKDLSCEIDEVKKRCHELESERKNLGRKLSANSSEAHLQIKSLKRDLEKMEDEKKRLVSRYEQEIAEAKKTADEKFDNIVIKKDAEAVELTEMHKTTIKELELVHNSKVEALLSSAKTEHRNELERLKVENSNEMNERLSDIQKLKELVVQYEKEISNLKDHINEQSVSHASTSDEVKYLQDKLRCVQDSLDNTKDLLTSAVSREENLQNELLQARKDHDVQLEKADINSKKSLKDLATDLDQQWGKKLRDECDRLRLELTIQQKEESDAEFKHILSLKDKEFEAYKMQMQQQVSYYQHQISQLRQDLQSSKVENEDSLRKASEEYSDQKANFEGEISKLKFDHSGEIENLYLENERRLKDLLEKHNKDLKKIEEELKADHQEAMQGLMMANRASLDALRHDYEKARNEELREIKNLHSEELERLRQTLHIQHQNEMEQQSLQFEEEIDYIKDELKKTKDLRSKEFGIHSAKIEELSSSMVEKEKEMNRIRNEVMQLQDNVKILNRELEGKVEEIRKVRREGNLNTRRKEQQLAKEHQNEMDELTADHLRETQKLLAEFNRAKELLKDKVEAFQLLLEQAEDKYRNRESRPEDLHAIDLLRQSLAEREAECLKLVEEKRYFQLELLNRETNFNKIFNSMPNVGVINPLQSSKKKRKSATDQWNLSGSKPAQRSSSGSSSPARLEPIPNTHIHEQRLNNSKPLPKAPVQGM
ncbi:protein FAM184A-like [Rhopilema esculentum]|uniref:protein FAM184A-like n=1 Tax=Rhopilema esculentum TaxID=499914 RepID=UPI0031E39E51